jgi:hypothetical protein
VLTVDPTLPGPWLATGTVTRAGSQPVLVPTGPADHPDHPFALELHGQDLPPDGTRAVIEGELTGRSLRVAKWRSEPHSTSAWTTLDVQGTDTATTDAVIDRLPEGWSVISVGVSPTTVGNQVVVLEVDHATPEVHDWVRKEPSGFVHLITFITPTPNT